MAPAEALGKFLTKMSFEDRYLKLACQFGQNVTPVERFLKEYCLEDILKALKELPSLDQVYAGKLMNHFEASNEEIMERLAFLIAENTVNVKSFRVRGSWISAKASGNLVTNGSTGHTIWPASLAFLDFLEDYGYMNGAVLELGSGTGFLAKALRDFYFMDVTTSDLIEPINTSPKHKYLDWHNPERIESFDIVLAADCIYDTDLIEPFVRTLRLYFSTHDTTAYIAQEVRNESTFAAFLEALSENNLEWQEVEWKTSGLYTYPKDRMRIIKVFKSLF